MSTTPGESGGGGGGETEFDINGSNNGQEEVNSRGGDAEGGSTEPAKTSKRNKRKKTKRSEDESENSSGRSDGGNGDRVPTHGAASLEEAPGTSSAIANNEPLPPLPSNFAQLDEIRRAMQLMSLQQRGAPRTADDALTRRYDFWSTQPVPRMDERITVNEPIEADLPQEMIRKEPFTLPDGFIWDTLDLEDPRVLRELYTLLSENYVEDDDCLFRFDYPEDFLIWALKPPGWKKDWHCGVRVAKNKKLIGFISAVPAAIGIHERVINIVEINFLCVHKRLRSKRVAPVLIREITRRVNLVGIFQAVYTAGVVLPKPITTCRYWHRSLNPKKLIETKFSHLTRNMTLQRTVKLYKLPAETKSPLRPMIKADVPKAQALLQKYLQKFKLRPEFNVEDFEHWFLPRPGIIDSFVVERNGTITDLVSYYTLPSTVVNNPQHKSIKAAYAFYNVATSMSLQELMHDALVVAKQGGFDVFNALDLMDNKQFLENLKFGVGDGNLQYYLYNWRCPSVEPQEIGLVLQ